MWFSPLKGAHLTLGQLDKTLPAEKSGDNLKIQRGSFIYVNAFDGTSKITPRFALYTDVQAKMPNAVPYIALMGIKDFQAGMAGNVGQAEQAAGIENDPNDFGGLDANGQLQTGNANFLQKKFTDGAQDFVGPRITGISLLQPAEYQTTAFEHSNNEVYYVGQPLTISANGKLTPYTGEENIVGYVTAEPFIRWINDLGASDDGARISGGNAKVIEFSTAWIPVAATAVKTPTTTPTSGEAADEGKVGRLNIDAPKAPAAPAADAPKAPAPAAPAPDAPKAPAAPAPAAPANKPQGK